MKKYRSLWTLVIVVLVGAAIADQLRLPTEQRTWHGTLWNVIPYDFRIPTIEKLKQTFWNANDSQVIVPRTFGVGWSINLYPLLQRVLNNNAV